MSSFNTALSAVFPLFAYLALGIFLRRIKLTDEHTLQKMNKVTLKVHKSIFRPLPLQTSLCRW